MLPARRKTRGEHLAITTKDLIKGYLEETIKPAFQNTIDDILSGKHPEFYQASPTHWVGAGSMNGWHVLNLKLKDNSPAYGFVNLEAGNILFSGVICTPDFETPLLIPFLTSASEPTLLSWAPIHDGAQANLSGLFS